jgi:hypothetical protein
MGSNKLSIPKLLEEEKKRKERERERERERKEDVPP